MHTIRERDFIIHHNPHKNILYGIYGSLITPNTTLMMYTRMKKLIAEIGYDRFHGIILDFRHVQQVAPGTALVLQRENILLQCRHDLSKIPLALLAESNLQLRMLDIALRFVSDKRHRRVVQTLREAQRFFHAWHQRSLGIR